MALTAGDFHAMEFIWTQMHKAPDAGHITLTQNDIDALWFCGFVDTGRHPLASWRAAFDGHRGPDGHYVLSETDFLSKDHYRYQGEIHVPFDALKINEGMYTDEGFQELLDDSIAPSTRAPAASFDRFFTALKQVARQPSGLLKIDLSVKRQIRQFIDQHPSPLRRLELIFDAMLREETWDFALTGDPPAAVAPEQVARVEASTFTMLPDNPMVAKGKALKALQKTRTAIGPGDDPTKPTRPLKQLRRSRKGMRG